MNTRIHRRSVLGAVGAAVTAAVAGCSDGGTAGEDGTTERNDTETTEGTDAGTEPDQSTATPSPTATEGGEDLTVDEFLADTSNYEGVEDLTGQDAVEVAVGAEGNGAFFAFDPPAIRIDPGTTVTWTWTGQGSTHNVLAVQGAEFESEVTAEEGHTFEQTFEDGGTVLYVCEPHRGTGMKGAVVVE